MIRAILHADRKWGIGKNNSLLFSLPRDMKFFRETTSGKTVVMGGNTLRSFPGGKPLKNRTNIVLSATQVRDDCIVVRTLDELKAEMKRRAEAGEDIYVIGGGSVYRALLPHCREVLVTKVDADGGADVFFPDLDEDPDFRVAGDGGETEDNGYVIRFLTYQNLAVKPL